MNKHEQQGALHDASTLAIQAAQVGTADRFLARVSPDLALEPVRRRADVANSTIMRSGRFRLAYWGIALLVLGAALATMAIFDFSSAFWLGIVSAISFTTGIMLLMRYEPTTALGHVEAFKRFAEDAEAEWNRNAERHVNGVVDQLLQALADVPSTAIGMGCSIRDVVAASKATVARARQIGVELDERGTTASSLVATAEEEFHRRTSDLGTKVRTWSAKLWADSVRRDASRVLEAREKVTAARRKATSLRLARATALAKVTAALDSAVTGLESGAVNPLVVLAENAARRSKELIDQDARNAFGKIVPPAADIASQAQQIITTHLSEIAKAVAARRADVPIDEAVRDEVRAVLGKYQVGPATLSEYIAGLNGTADMVLAQLSAEAAEMAVTQPTPGRPQRRLRTVLTGGGATATVTRAIEQRSEGFLVRGLDSDDRTQIIQIDHSRFEPGPELVELRNTAQAMEQLDESARAALVTAVDDDDLVLRDCRPEERDQPDRGLRQLVYALVFGIIVRRRAIYELAAAMGGSDTRLIGRSFEGAVALLQDNTPKARHVQQAVVAEITKRGSAGVRSALEAAMKQPDMVPADQLEVVRGVLAAELARG